MTLSKSEAQPQRVWVIEQLQKRGDIAQDGDTFRLTPQGLDRSCRIFNELPLAYQYLLMCYIAECLDAIKEVLDQ